MFENPGGATAPLPPDADAHVHDASVLEWFINTIKNLVWKGLLVSRLFRLVIFH